jgi:hypothetical protein
LKGREKVMAAEEAKAAVEVVKNCPACKKPLKKSRKYYRNGAYYCNSTCFKKVQATANAAKAEAKEAEAKEAESKEAAAKGEQA